jgi:DNA-binding NtrC family response regulator
LELHQTFHKLVDHLVVNGFFLQEAIEILEKTLITRTLEKTGGNRSEASKRLGIHRNTLQKKVAEYKLEAASYRKPVRSSTKRARRSSAA